MSLKVWLPLNGNTNNQGTLYQLDSVKTCTNPKYNTDMGGGIEFTGNEDNLLLFPEKELYLAYTDNFTISGWFYNDSLNDWANIHWAFTIGRADYGEMGIGLRISDKLIIFYYNVYTYGISIENNTWYHLSFVKRGTTGYYYINGILIGTNTLNTNPSWSTSSQEYCGLGLGCFYYGNYYTIYTYKGKIKDFRIYDEALFPQQIKDLSRGLFVHYKLNQPERSENLIIGTDKYIFSNPLIHIDSRSDGWVYYNFVVPNITNKTITVSVCCDGNIAPAHYLGNTVSKSFTFWLVHYDKDNNQIIHTCLNGTEHNYKKIGNYLHRWDLTIDNDTSFLAIRTNLYSNGTDSYTLKFWNIKVEEGVNDNPQWTPNENNWGDTEYDGSGFCNHGQLIGSVSSDFTTPRYNLAYSFNNSGYIKNDNFNCTVNACTISFWIKPKSSLNHQHFIFSTHNNWMQNGISMWCDPGAESSGNIYYATSRSGAVWGAQYAITWDVDTWQMITLVTDGTKYYSYKNGQLIEIQDLVYNSIYNPVLYVGSSLYGDINAERAEGSLSDFRFYTSALSADDIKEIYNYRK